MIGGKVIIELIRQIIAGWCLQTFYFQKFVDNAQLPYYLKQTFPPIIGIFTEGESDGIKSRLPFKIFFTLPNIVRTWWLSWAVAMQCHTFEKFLTQAQNWVLFTHTLNLTEKFPNFSWLFSNIPSKSRQTTHMYVCTL